MRAVVNFFSISLLTIFLISCNSNSNCIAQRTPRALEAGSSEAFEFLNKTKLSTWPRMKNGESANVTSFFCVQVVDSENAIIRHRTHEYWYRGNTAGMVDKETVERPRAIVVDGAHTYTNALNQPRTIAMIRDATAGELDKMKQKAQARFNQNRELITEAKVLYGQIESEAKPFSIQLPDGKRVLRKAVVIGFGKGKPRGMPKLETMAYFENDTTVVKVAIENLHKNTTKKISGFLDQHKSIISKTGIYWDETIEPFKFKRVTHTIKEKKSSKLSETKCDIFEFTKLSK